MRKLYPLFMGILLLFAVPLVAQKTVTGTVSDENANPVANASVLVKGTTTGTVTGVDGKYSISVPAAGRILVFSAVDRPQVEVSIGDRTVINVTLRASDRTLDEVVLTGYATRK